MLFEAVMNKRKSMIEGSLGTFGGSSSSSSSKGIEQDAFDGPMTDVRELVNKMNNSDGTDLSYVKDGDIMDYVGGPITAGGQSLFGYNKTEKQDSEN
jgi:hypothetical protein